jgi:predicted nucleic acid-binding protein
MKVVVDSNIAFSAILNLDSKIGQILIKSGTLFAFYLVPLLKDEVLEYKEKIQKLAHYSDEEFYEVIELVFHKIEFIDDCLIPKQELIKAEKLASKVDVDDVLFVALTNHLRARLWTGDRILKRGLERQGWYRFVTVEELYVKIIERGK